MITIYYNNTSINIEPTDASYRYRKIMGDDCLVITFNYAGWLELPVGAYCDFNGTRYTLMSPQGFTKRGNRNYEYKLTMYAPYYIARKYKFRNRADGRLRFSISCKPQQIVEEIVANLNDRESGNPWTVGGYPEADNVLMDFNHTSVAEALNKAAQAFNTEWYFVNKAVYLGKLEDRSNYISLSYGGDGGFIPGVVRTNADEGGGIERLYVQGGDRNIDFSTYGTQTMRLPTSSLLLYDPINDKFSDETGYEPANRREYMTDANGIYIERYDKAKSTNYEDSFDGSEFYPSRVGTVTSVAAVGTTTYKIYDTSIDFNYEDYIIGTSANKMTLVFQSGVLAGREFDVDYNNNEKSFTLVPIEVEGQTMPAGNFIPSAGGGGENPDTYAVFGIRLPQQYITSAEKDMYKAAVRYMAQHEDMRLTYKGTLDPVYAKTHQASVETVAHPGNFVSFSDGQFLPTPTMIRIVGVKEYINDPMAPELELSNLTIQPISLSSALGKTDDLEARIESANQQQDDSAMRRWLAMQRTWAQAESIQQAMQEAIDSLEGDFTEGISPVTINTMAMLVGDARCQFEFVTTNPGSTKDTNFAVTYNNLTGVISAPATILKHLTLGLSVTSSAGRSDSDYRYWNMSVLSEQVSADLGAVYIYAVCDKGSNSGAFYLSDRAYELEADDRYGDPSYFFLVGILSALDDQGNRSFAQMYGFTQVTPGGITTNEVRSANGKTVMNLANGQFRVGDLNSNYIRWNGTAFEINGLLLAQQAFIDKLGVRNVEIKNNIGSIVGGMQTYEDANTVPYLWLGGDTPDAAPFRVDGNGSLYAQKGTFAGFVQIPYKVLSTCGNDGSYYRPGSNAYILSDYTNASYYVGSNGARVKLPTPNASRNGFTYDIVVWKMTALQSEAEIELQADGGSVILCMAGTNWYTNKTKWHLDVGRYIITCMPISGSYYWVITQASSNGLEPL